MCGGGGGGCVWGVWGGLSNTVCVCVCVCVWGGVRRKQGDVSTTLHPTIHDKNTPITMYRVIHNYTVITMFTCGIVCLVCQSSHSASIADTLELRDGIIV